MKMSLTFIWKNSKTIRLPPWHLRRMWTVIKWAFLLLRMAEQTEMSSGETRRDQATDGHTGGGDSAHAAVERRLDGERESMSFSFVCVWRRRRETEPLVCQVKMSASLCDALCPITIVQLGEKERDSERGSLSPSLPLLSSLFFHFLPICLGSKLLWLGPGALKCFKYLQWGEEEKKTKWKRKRKKKCQKKMKSWFL